MVFVACLTVPAIATILATLAIATCKLDYGTTAVIIAAYTIAAVPAARAMLAHLIGIMPVIAVFTRNALAALLTIAAALAEIECDRHGLA
jgi:hypothetical protein